MQNTGREKEFCELIKEHERLIYKVCTIYSSNANDKVDLFQDIVLQLWKSFGNFRGESKLSTWIYRVGINTAISGKRKWMPMTEFDTEFHSAIAIENPHEKQLMEEQSAGLFSAIKKLNEIEKAIVVLYLEDKPYDEMSEVLGISAATLRVKMNRIKEKLRVLTKTN